MPGANAGIRNRIKNPLRLWPSMNAISSKERGIAVMKLSRIQIAIGKLKTQWTSAMPTGVFTRPARAKSMKIGSDKTTGGVTRNASKKIRNVGHQQKSSIVKGELKPKPM